jgi:hypothetical protein
MSLRWQGKPPGDIIEILEDRLADCHRARERQAAVLRVLAANLPAFADALAKQDHPAPCGTDQCIYCWVEGMLADAAQDIPEVSP